MKGEIEIIDHKPLISDEEIEAFKDFNGLLSKFQESQHAQKQISKTRLMGTGTVLIAGMSLLYFFSKDVQGDKDQYPEPPSRGGKEIIGITVPVPDSTGRVKLPEPAREEEEKETGLAQAIQQKKSAKNSEPTVSMENQQNEGLISKGYVPAAPAKGYDHLYEYFNRELQYPEAAAIDSITGTLEVYFMITAEGLVKDVRLENSLGERVDAEAIRVIQNMPEWRPATIRGKPIRSSLSIPLRFDIAKKNTE